MQTTVKELAKLLGFIYVNTGHMYRAVAKYAIENNIPYIKTEKDNLIYKIILNTEFNEAINDLNKLSDRIINRSNIDINLINVHVDKENKTITLNRDIESYLVIEPSWLINVSALANFDYCDRKFFHNRFQGTSQNEAMIRGSIVHEVFEDVLKNKPIDEIVKTQWKDSFHKRSLDFYFLKKLNYK